MPGYHSTTPTPPPVAWDPGRDARGAAPSRGPRCPRPDCPVRYVSGPDRPCPEHATARPGLTDRQRAMIRAALAIARTPARRRIVRALMRDPCRPSPVIAGAVTANKNYVWKVRREMEAAGLITVYRSHGIRRAEGRDRITAELSRDPARPNRAIADEAGGDSVTAMRVRHEMEAAGLIPVWRPWTRETVTLAALT